MLETPGRPVQMSWVAFRATWRLILIPGDLCLILRTGSAFRDIMKQRHVTGMACPESEVVLLLLIFVQHLAKLGV